MLHDPALLDAVEALAVVGGWRGVVWRQTIGSREPLFPNSRGARWNPAGAEALYCSLSQSGAEAEVAHLMGKQPVKSSRPLVMSEVRVSLGRVVDLRGADALQEVGFSTDLLTVEDWTAAQQIGAAAKWLGFAGMLVPSARHPDGNLVVFVNNLESDDEVEIAGSS